MDDYYIDPGDWITELVDWQLNTRREPSTYQPSPTRSDTPRQIPNYVWPGQ